MISVVIPTIGRPEDLARTVASLRPQLAAEDEIVILEDPERRGAGWARNRGVEKAKGDLLLFSDDDIVWAPGTVSRLKAALERADDGGSEWTTGYAYGGYRLSQAPRTVFSGPFCVGPWSYEKLKKTNIASTMALVQREVFPGFDETLPMLEDWDLWLKLAASKIRGKSLESVVFSTPFRADGITYGKMSKCDAVRYTVLTKHFALLDQRGAIDGVRADSVATSRRGA